MELYFSERFKKYRKERELTQDQTAKMFDVSPQAVSKWERGEGYPDITLLPRIANFFGVTIDILLGNDEVTKGEDIRCFFENIGEMEPEDEETVRYAIEYSKKYPNEDNITYHLAWVITQLPEEKREPYLPLLGETCEKILRECTYQGFREGAIQFMCSTCEDSEFSKWYAMCADDYNAFKGEVLENRLWEKKKYAESRLRHEVNSLHLMLHFMFRENRNHREPEKAAEWFDYRIKMIDFFASDNGGEIPEAWIGAYAELHFRMSCALFGCGRADEGYEYLEKALAIYPKWYAIPNGTPLDVGSSQVFGGVKIVKDSWMLRIPNGAGGWTDEWCSDMTYFNEWRGLMHYAMTAESGWEWFDSVRGEERFKEYVEKAKKLAGIE